MSRTGSTRHLLAAFAALVMVAFSLGLAPAYADDSGTTSTSGEDTSQPQPLSRADQNDAGANGQCPDGPYCSTRDGSPSENGNGDGEAKGKPCAGCVGKADNKNPRGQMPDGSDANKGYECDDNNGVGKSNPAHTGCTSDEDGGSKSLLSKTTTKKTSKKTTHKKTSKQGAPEVAGVQAQTDDAPQVLGVQASRTRASSDAAPAGANRAAPALAPSASALPNTGAGSHLGLMLGAGLALLAAGAAAMVARGRLARR